MAACHDNDADYVTAPHVLKLADGIEFLLAKLKY